MNNALHTIRLCKIDEKEKLKKFINSEWKNGHIMSHCDELLDFQHLDKKKGVYNFVVAYNKKSKEFDAVLGFIITKQYDRSLKDSDIWLAIWKAKDEYPSLGLQLILELQHKQFSSIGAMGISTSGLKFYKALKYHLGIMSHFFIKNDSLPKYTIAQFDTLQVSKQLSSNDVSIRQIDENIFLESKLTYLFYPRKSKQYFINRYLRHKFYHYELQGIYKNENLLGAFIVREIVINGVRVCRIIDYIGEFVKGCYGEFQRLLIDKNAEYIDLLCHIPNNAEILDMGFRQKMTKEIIPNYFEPYEKRNIDVAFAYKSKNLPYVFFKGDSDQDRPNFINQGDKQWIK